MSLVTLLPADKYVVVNKTILTEQDRKYLVSLYEPIIGSLAVSLYLTLWRDLDRYNLVSVDYTHHHLMTILKSNLDNIKLARKTLEAVGLVKTYYEAGEPNNYVYELYSPMTPKEFYDMLKKFGFGAKTGIDLPGESSGLLPYYGNWDQGILATMSYGYGTSVTAMQMISAVQALANNGVRVTPHVIKYSPEEEALKVQRTQVLSPETAHSVTRLLAASVNHGRSVIKMDKYNVAAKTGTSRKPKENSSGYTPFTYTSTIGFLPASDPQILVYVMVDSAKVGAIWGNTVAGPVFHEVTTQVARIMNLKPDKVPAPKKVN